MRERKYYGNYVLAAGMLIFVLMIGWSLWFTIQHQERTDELAQQYAQACNQQGGMAHVIDGMYQCVKWRY